MERWRPMRRGGRALLAGLLALGAVLAAPAADVVASAGAGGADADSTGGGHGHGGSREPALPIVFVHGGSGSGAQYQTQAQRFASNGYPNLVTAVDRISADPAVIYPILDDFFDDVRERTDDEQIYVVGHSQGVAVMNGYLNSSPERAARVAKYIGIDSASGPSPDVCPGGTDEDGEWVVPCMGVWGRGDPARRFGPDRNVQFPDQGHVEVVGSPQSFAAQHEFFTGRAPRTTAIVPESPGRVRIAGRALNFPANTPLVGSTVELWEVDAATGARRGTRPRAVQQVGEDGNWGPFRVDGRRRYELALTRDDFVQHYYFEPFVRSDRLVRLNLSPADSALSRVVPRSDRHSVVVVQRQKEWWGNHPTASDRLTVATRSAHGDQPPVDIVNGATAPVTGNAIGLVTFDAGTDGVTHAEAPLPLAAFVSGVDVFYPAADPPDGTVTLTHAQRGREGRQVINVPNWASAGHGLTVTFRDW